MLMAANFKHKKSGYWNDQIDKKNNQVQEENSRAGNKSAGGVGGQSAPVSPGVGNSRSDSPASKMGGKKIGGDGTKTAKD